VTFRDVQINNPLKQSMREALFVEPQLGKAYTRINLAERTPGTASPTTIRETRPCRRPAASGSASRRRSRGKRPRATSGAAHWPWAERSPCPHIDDGVVGPRFPTAPEPEFLKGESAGWRAATSPGPVP